jgi:hypothetical protein
MTPFVALKVASTKGSSAASPTFHKAIRELSERLLDFDGAVFRDLWQKRPAKANSWVACCI